MGFLLSDPFWPNGNFLGSRKRSSVIFSGSSHRTRTSKRSASDIFFLRKSVKCTQKFSFPNPVGVRLLTVTEDH